jgi:cytochrome c2
MKVNTKVVLKYATLISLVFVIFIYGILAGRYQLFPFGLIQNLKDKVTETMRPGSEAINYEGQVETTSLQRLYINKLYLAEDKGRGGAMATDSLDVFILDREGGVHFLDLENFELLETDVPSIPMGFDLLTESGLQERDDFMLRHFRVSGAHVEKASENQFILFVYHHFFDGQCFSSKLSRMKLQKTENRVTSGSEWEEVFTTEPCLQPIDEDLYEGERWAFAGHMSGGRIIRYDENHLMLTIGDYHFDGFKIETVSMDPENPYGKFVLVNVNSGEWSIYANGSRNAQGLYRDKDGVIWSTEHGPQGGDELNIVEEGKNFGWPVVSLGINYRNRPWGESDDQGRHDRYAAPLYAWVPSIGISDLIRIESEKFNLWAGDLIVTSMSDQTLHRLRPDSTNSRIIYDEIIDVGHRIRNINVIADGSILLRTDDNYLIHIDDAGPVYESFDYPEFMNENTIARRFSTIDNGTDQPDLAMSGEEIFSRSCADCHSMDQRMLRGPNLENLANRQVGGMEAFDYSAVLERSDRDWDSELLSDYILSPQQVFPGTTMSGVNLSDEELRQLVEYLLEEQQE